MADFCKPSSSRVEHYSPETGSFLGAGDETVVGLDLILVLSTARLCSLNVSLRRRLVSPKYCKLQR